MKKFLVLYLFTLMSVFLFSDNIKTEYGHVSYVEPDSQVFIERFDGQKDKAVINLPIVPGDRIISDGKSRCEIQFNNGTIIRMDHNTDLKVVTILAQALTTKKSISTLELSEGTIYIMAKSYNKEIFQIKTENSAALFRKSSVAILQSENKNTNFKIFKGSIDIILGKDKDSIKETRIKSKHTYSVNSKDNLIKNIKINDKKFLSWNKEINKNFLKLHRGISKVPKPIRRYSKGIINWAEKWSSLYGKWVYNDIFGYVWSPNDKKFGFHDRPFFDAEYVNINGKLFVVPSQKWGWAPAQLGSWIFMKNSGWVWIPGNAFSGGIPYTPKKFGNLSHYYAYNNINYWIDKQYGSLDLYYIFRERGKRAWEKKYTRIYGKIEKGKIKPPVHIKKILSKMNRSYISKLKDSISQHKPIVKTNLHLKIRKNSYFQKQNSIKSKISHIQKTKSQRGIHNTITKINHRDFNPDTKWALQKNVKIRYSSKTNEVICDSIKVYKKFLKKNPRSHARNSNKKGSYSKGSQNTSSISKDKSSGSASKKK